MTDNFTIVDAPTRKGPEPKWTKLIDALLGLEEGKAIQLSVPAGEGKRPGVAARTQIQSEAREAGFTARFTDAVVSDDGSSVILTIERAALRATPVRKDKDAEVAPEA